MCQVSLRFDVLGAIDSEDNGGCLPRRAAKINTWQSSSTQLSKDGEQVQPVGHRNTEQVNNGRERAGEKTNSLALST